MAEFNEISQGVIEGDVNGIEQKVQQFLDDGKDPLKIIKEGLIAGMAVVGERFKGGEMFVPEVLMSAKAMNTGLDLVKPLITEDDLPTVGHVVIGTVKGDLHDIGKNLVAMLMESNGFKVDNLGVDVSPEKFVEFIKEKNPDVLAMSAMLTTTMVKMQETVELLKEEGLRDKVKIMIGGAPVTSNYSDEIGADGYSVDASAASDLCKNLVG